MSGSRGDERVIDVVIIEDDDVIGRQLDLGLRNHGYRTSWHRTGTSGRHQVRERRPDVLLLDLGLPDVDGVDLARTLRAEDEHLLILILTARGDDIDMVAGLDAGADDYLVKPVSTTTLLARLRAHLRRRPPVPHDAPPVRIGDLLVDPASRRCFVSGAELVLRPKEFELLLALASAAGVAVSREDLMARVWDENWFGPTKTLDVTMAALRQRLAAPAGGDGPPRLPTIVTLRGHGYRLDSPSPTSGTG